MNMSKLKKVLEKSGFFIHGKSGSFWNYIKELDRGYRISKIRVWWGRAGKYGIFLEMDGNPRNCSMYGRDRDIHISFRVDDPADIPDILEKTYVPGMDSEDLFMFKETGAAMRKNGGGK